MDDLDIGLSFGYTPAPAVAWNLVCSDQATAYAILDAYAGAHDASVVAESQEPDASGLYCYRLINPNLDLPSGWHFGPDATGSVVLQGFGGSISGPQYGGGDLEFTYSGITSFAMLDCPMVFAPNSGIGAYFCSALTTLRIVNCPGVLNISGAYSNAAITTAEITNCPALTILYMNGASSTLTSLVLGGLPAIQLVDFQATPMSSDLVDYVLQACVDTGEYGSSVDVSGSSAPSLAGLIAADILISRSWTANVAAPMFDVVYPEVIWYIVFDSGDGTVGWLDQDGNIGLTAEGHEISNDYGATWLEPTDWEDAGGGAYYATYTEAVTSGVSLWRDLSNGQFEIVA